MNRWRNIYKAQDVRVSMRREVVKRVFVFTVLALFMLSFMVSFVGAQDAETYVGNVVEKTKDIFGALFTAAGWDTLTENTANTAKIMFFVMITIILYLLISSFLKKNQIISIILAAIISFLFTVYIAPAEIYSMLASYTAAGMAIITLVPLGILALFTYKAAKDGEPSAIMLQWLAWGLYAAYLIYRIILDYFWLKEGSVAVNGIVLAVGLIAAAMFIFNKTITRAVAKRFTETQTESAERMLQEVWDTRRAEKEAARRATGGS